MKMQGLRAPSRACTLVLFQLPLHRRYLKTHYRTDGASTAEPASPLNAGITQLNGLTLTQLARPGGVLDGEPLKTLTRLAAANQSCQVLEAISKTSLVLRDAALASSRGASSPHSADIGLQTLFQNGYDTLVALLQALPQCSSAYGPAAVIPETCVTLFHVHNLLLQAAYASQQEFDVWTELMQAGLELYLRRAPRHLVVFSSGHLEPLMDALAHQDLWRLQRMLWQRMLVHIPSWDSMQDFCSVVHGCELAAQAATTAAVAAAAAVSHVGSGGGDLASTRLLTLDFPTSTDSTSPLPTSLTSRSDECGLAWAARWLHVPDSSSTATPSDPSCSPRQLPIGPASHCNSGSYSTIASRTAPATAAAASALYDKQAELAEYGGLMAECIHVCLEVASVRALAVAQHPHEAAVQLVEMVVGFEERQRSPSALAALRYAFVPTTEWLNRVAAAGVQGGDRLSAAQVVKLIQDLDALAPQMMDGSTGGGGERAANRWLGAGGQVTVERAILRHTSSRAWSPQQAVSVIKAISGKCIKPPGDQLCGLMEGLLLGFSETRQDVGLLCAILQEAVEMALPSQAAGEEDSDAVSTTPAAAAILSPPHLSLVKVALNRASYLVEVEATAPSTDPDAATSTSYANTPSGAARAAAGTPMWRSREFLFERYPQLLQAARRFGYPLQAFRTEEYSDQLYIHLATSPGHELVAVGPEGLALVLRAVASTPCCRDPQWAAAFERACLTLLSVQFAVGYTHPKRWLGLLETTVSALPFPMPALAAAVKALLVRLCDVRRHAKYFWHVLPLVGALERRAAEAQHRSSSSTHAMSSSSSLSQSPMWTPVSGAANRSASVRRKTSLSGKSRNVNYTLGSGGHRRVPAGRGPVAAASSGMSNTSSSSSLIPNGSSGSSHRPMLPPPDLSTHLVTEEEYSRWCEEVGQRLALSMACLSDQDRVAQLSVFGIGVAAGQQ